MNEHVRLPATLPDLDEIEDGFNLSMERFAEAFQKISDAEQAIKSAWTAIERVTPGAITHSPHDCHEIKEFEKAVRLPDRDLYLTVARKLVNLRCWHYVIDRCGMQQLMDTEAKKELDAQLRYVPQSTQRSRRERRDLIDEDEMAKLAPEFTADNARGMMEKFAMEAGMIWRRGIANAFSSLDRRFKSHDGFKVGSRMILTRFASWDSGRVDTYGSTAETFRDIERTFQILDGRDPRNARSDFLYQVHNERRGYDPHQSKHYGEYFRVDIFKNGNAHLWFTRDDLVEKVNLELAAYYGEVIGDGNTREPDIFEQRAKTPAKLFGFYPTPHELADRVCNQLPYSETPYRILEPSAGTGNLAFRLLRPRMINVKYRWDEELGDRVEEGDEVQDVVDCIEIQPALATALRESGKFGRVVSGDFLEQQPDPSALYDGIVMNPPFDLERDIDHVTHALKFLKPDGFLLSIMSAGTEFRETRKAAAFRKLLAERKGWMKDLPPGSFSSVGTHVNTVLVGFGMSEPWSRW